MVSQKPLKSDKLAEKAHISETKATHKNIFDIDNVT